MHVSWFLSENSAGGQGVGALLKVYNVLGCGQGMGALFTGQGEELLCSFQLKVDVPCVCSAPCPPENGSLDISGHSSRRRKARMFGSVW